MKTMINLSGILLFLLSCNEYNKGNAKDPYLKKFKTYLAQEVREEIEYSIEHQIESEKQGRTTIIRAYKNFECGLCCNFYTGSINVRDDSLFLVAQYGYLGEGEEWPTVYTDLCTHAYTAIHDPILAV